MTRVKDRYKQSREASAAEKSMKNVVKNVRKNIKKNVMKNRGHPLCATTPAKSPVSANCGSDLLLFASNKSAAVGTTPVDQPQLLHEGQTVYLRQRRSAS